MIQEGTFREDFYYRINVINLRLPPLRERREDIPALVEHFIEKFNRELDMDVVGIEPEAMIQLENYTWPGNIRELENCIERAFNYVSGTVIGVKDLNLPGPKYTASASPSSDTISTLKQVRSQAERFAILRALELCNGNKTAVAERLGIDRSILYDKMKRYGLL